MCNFENEPMIRPKYLDGSTLVQKFMAFFEILIF